jgi:hypothetical protein
MIPGAEQRPAVGIRITRHQEVDGPHVLPSLYIRRGPGFVPVNEIPLPNGQILRVGRADLVDSEKGKEILWNMGDLKARDARKFVTGYIQDNGYDGDPQVLQRALEMMQ